MPGLAHSENYYDSIIQGQMYLAMYRNTEEIRSLIIRQWNNPNEAIAPAKLVEIPEELYKSIEKLIWDLLVSPEMTELNDIQGVINRTFPGIKQTLLIAAFREAIDKIFVAALNGTLK